MLGEVDRGRSPDSVSTAWNQGMCLDNLLNQAGLASVGQRKFTLGVELVLRRT